MSAEAIIHVNCTQCLCCLGSMITVITPRIGPQWKSIAGRKKPLGPLTLILEGERWGELEIGGNHK